MAPPLEGTLMRWEDEPYVRFYKRNTPEFLDLSWRARGLLGLLMREVDRAGILELQRKGLPGVAIILRAPWAEIEEPLYELLSDGCVQFNAEERRLVIPNFLSAQEIRQTDAQRKRDQRERDRARAVTTGHQPSPEVTGGHSVLCLTEQDQDPPPAAGARAESTMRAIAGPSSAVGTLTAPPEDIPVDDDLRGRCAMAGAPMPTPADVQACLANARDRGKLSADWRAAIVSWMRQKSRFDKPVGPAGGTRILQPVPATGRVWKVPEALK